MSTDPKKLIIAALMVGVLLGMLSWLQRRFDDSDHKKASALVESYRPQSGDSSLVQAILKRHPGVAENEISWSSEIRQSCVGHVRVHAYVPARPQHAAETYGFDVNLSGPSVHPTDEKTVAILRSLTATITRSTTSTAANADPRKHPDGPG